MLFNFNLPVNFVQPDFIEGINLDLNFQPPKTSAPNARKVNAHFFHAGFFTKLSSFFQD